MAGAALIVGPGCSPNIQAQPPGFGPGGPGGPDQADQELVEKFDDDANGWLNDSERKEARDFLAANPTQRGFGGPGGFRGRGEGRGPGEGRDRGEGRGADFGPPPGFGPGPGFGPPADGGPPPGDEAERGRGRRGGGPPGMNRDRPEPTPGQTITKESVSPIKGDLYDPQVVRTVFLDFSNDDWEEEMETFHSTWKFPPPSPSMANRIPIAASASVVPRRMEWSREVTNGLSIFRSTWPTKINGSAVTKH